MPVVHANAGRLPATETLENIPGLMSSYYTEFPDSKVLSQRVNFGTSGHRGTSRLRTFNEEHVYAITQAVCDYRTTKGITGPLFLGRDTHALSEAAFRSALEVLAANGVTACIAKNNGYTATPAVSRAILRWNKNNPLNLSDGIVITPSHNPPSDGGFKYNPPHGGPAETEVTAWIENKANAYLESNNHKVRIKNLPAALDSAHVREYDFVGAYAEDLSSVLDIEAIAGSGLRLGVDPLGGASLALWERIAETCRIPLTIVNREVDPTFRFVPCDKDGKIRMDCSSPYAMRRLLDLRGNFDLAFACDPDADRHGIVTRQELMNPNHYLTVAAWYLFRTRTAWPAECGIGKTLVTSAMLDRIGRSLSRPVVEVPVGFKWFVPYLHSGHCGFACEESAGASFLCFDGSPWSTDKDGPLLCLLAAEIMAREQLSPSELYGKLTRQLGTPLYQRLDAPADDRVRNALNAISPDDVSMKTLGGSPVTRVLTRAPANGVPIGGVKVTSRNGWFAVRPSGTEAICKVYTESFDGQEHLGALQHDALAFLENLLKNADT
ncbi:MAG: alpha-D-glucose phosphate-specific phosphoglucomutase [Desulfovibrio sp.]|jgi:phosphoglucomutase|nr:alpha-D-glucose phosphate-specific phosphoglucomutase [Desulfovibrio sp.]